MMQIYLTFRTVNPLKYEFSYVICHILFLGLFSNGMSCIFHGTIEDFSIAEDVQYLLNILYV